jgi:hypothetical protein
MCLGTRPSVLAAEKHFRLQVSPLSLACGEGRSRCIADDNGGGEGSAVTDKNLNRVRGWLLVFVVILVPHGVRATLMLFSPELRSVETPLGLATLGVTAIGNLLSIALVLSKHRWAPAFITLYLPLLLVLNLLNPDLVGTVNARMGAAGSTGEVGPLFVFGLLAMNLLMIAVWVGYWMKSERVQAVFGSRGLQLLRKSPQL